MRKLDGFAKVLLFVGAIFLFIGVVFVALCVVMWVLAGNEPGFMELGVILLPVFGGVGLIFAVIGVIMLTVVTRRAKKNKRLLEEGTRVMAEVLECYPDYSVRVNRRPTFTIRCAYRMADGKTYIFTSGMHTQDPAPYFVGNKVCVYYNPQNLKDYFVDVMGTDPNIVEL